MSKKIPPHKEEENSYWSSYSDMMAALLLMFALIIAVTMLKSKMQYEAKEQELQKQRTQLIEQQTKLDELLRVSDEREDELREQQIKLDKLQQASDERESELSEKENLIEEQRTKLDKLLEVSDERTRELFEKELFVTEQQIKLDQLQQVSDERESELSEKESLIEEQKTKLEELQQVSNDRESKLSEKENLIEEQQTIMEQQQIKLDKFVGVRSSLIEALKKEFAGSDLSVLVDPQTGAITFDSSILFDFNDAKLKETGKEFLVSFLPRYISILLGNEFSEYISEIIIEGHTDTAGSFLFNLELSQQRALAVAAFCLDENSDVKLENLDSLREIITANGRSYSNPIYKEDGMVDMEASRRVEFKFRLKDDEMISEMRDILSE